MTDTAIEQRDKLMGDLRVVIHDAEELLKATTDEAGAGVAEVRSRIQARLQQAKMNLSHLQDLTISKAKAAGHATDEYVHDNPWTSIGVAAGVGILIGILAARR